jgi:hypothetical protein
MFDVSNLLLVNNAIGIDQPHQIEQQSHLVQKGFRDKHFERSSII